MRNFWKRQFAPTATRGQRIFDFFFGVLTPWVCILLDPIVFQTGFGSGGGILANFQIFAYAEIVLSTVALACYLFFRRSSTILAGFFFAGALFSLAVGIVIFPLALVALIIYIGALGLTPLVTAFVYFRNGIRAWKNARLSSTANPAAPLSRSQSLRTAVASAVLAAIFLVGAPALLQVYVVRTTTRAIATIESGSESDSLRAISTLKHLRFVFNTDDLASAFERAQDPARRERLSRAFLAVTGKDVRDRLAILHD